MFSHGTNLPGNLARIDHKDRRRGAILTAAVFRVFDSLVVVSQTIYANTMENIEEYATIESLGSAQVARGAHRPHQALLWVQSAAFWALHGDSGCRSREVADSLDLYALVVCPAVMVLQA